MFSEGKDSWGVFDPKGRERIFDLIGRTGSGACCDLGDRRRSGVAGFRGVGFHFYEFEAASLGGQDGPR